MKLSVVRPSLAASLLLPVALLSANASAVEIYGVFDDEVQRNFSLDTEDSLAISFEQSAYTFDGPLQLTVLAPEGQMITATATGSKALSLQLRFGSGGAGLSENTSFSFIGLTGSAPTISYSGAAVSGNGNLISFSTSINGFDEPFSFKGIQITGDGIGNGATLDVAQGALFAYDYQGQDVAPMLEVTQVPLPTAGWLFIAGLGLLSGVARERRSH